MRHGPDMPAERLAFLRAINAVPRDRVRQLAFADWLDEHGEGYAAAYWRGRVGLVGLVGIGGLGGFGRRVGIGGLGGFGRRVGIGGRGGRGGIGAFGGLGGLGAFGGRVGVGGRGGLGGLGSRVDLVGRVGFVGLYSPENQIVLIPGENAMVFVPNGYGFSVLVGYVSAEYPHGWVLDPAREVINTNGGDCWVELAGGDAARRAACTYGPPVKGGGFRVPLGCPSLPWVGPLPGGEG